MKSDESHEAFVGVGSNLADRAATLRGAVDRLRQVRGITVVATSSVYETEPIGLADQPAFLNQVVGLATTLSPEELLQALLAIETEFGRVRDVRWGPRTLDLDLLWYGKETRATPELTLPHPRMFERAFVLVPLREVLQQPQYGVPSWDVLRAKITAANVPDTGVRAVPSPG